MALRPRSTFALVALLLLPTALATWGITGDFEPDTPQDVASMRMWTEPDTSPSGMKAYFDVVAVDSTTNANPNAGVLRTRILTSGSVSMNAWLGVWKDCNGDGYVGLAETAALEYAPQVLLDDSICPPGSMWNHHRWVSEFVHIGPASAQNSASFPRVLRDDDAKVWGDLGRPGADDTRYLCTTTMLPRGTLDSTGAMLRHADCLAGYRVVPAFNALDASAGTGLAFSDPYHPERDCDHPLNAHLDINGDDPCAPDDPGALEGGSGHPAFTVLDCSTSPGTPSVDVVDPDGSYWDGARTSCQTALGDGPLERAPPGLATTESGTNPTDGKRRPDFTFTFNVGFGAGSFDAAYPEWLGLTGRTDAPWTSVETYAPPANMGGTFRGGSFEPAGGLWSTFYAYVGPRTLERGVVLRDASTAIYGSEACGDADSGVANGWDCDATHWWSPDHGGIANAQGARPGESYRLRDTDCFDGQVSDGTGVFVSLATLSNDLPCPAAGG